MSYAIRPTEDALVGKPNAGLAMAFVNGLHVSMKLLRQTNGTGRSIER
jgi:hypothetical protein